MSTPSAVPGGSAACAGWGGVGRSGSLGAAPAPGLGSRWAAVGGPRAAGGRQAPLLGDRGAVGDEHERGEHVDGEAQEIDGVGGHPQRDHWSSHVQ